MARSRIKVHLLLAAKVLVLYLAVGVVYGMVGEMRSAAVHADNSLSALRDSGAYMRSVKASPVWARDMIWAFNDCADPFGCKV